MEIHIVRNGKKFGPFTLEEINGWLKEGRLLTTDLAWREGMAGWIALNSFPGVEVRVTTKPEPPPFPNQKAKVSDALVWVSAFVPLFGIILAQMGLDFWVGTIIVVATNIVLLSKDEQQLKASGWETDKLGGAWLVPVYLFRRVDLVASGYGYAVAWLVSFIFSFLIPS